MATAKKIETEAGMIVAATLVTVKVNPDKNASPSTAYTVRWQEGKETRVETVRNEAVAEPVQVPREHELVDQLLANKLVVEVR